jgi:hypothetical protein
MVSCRVLETPFLHYFLKTPRRQDFKLTFKNKSKRLLAVDFTVIKNEEVDRFFDILVHP